MRLSHPTEERAHWLVDVARASGLSDLGLEARAPFSQIRAAWAEIARVSGISEEELAERVSRHFRLTRADLSTFEPQTAKLIPEKTARKHGVLPLRATDHLLVVATSDPVNMEAEQEIQFVSGRQPVFQLAAPGPLLEAIERAYSREKIVDFVLQTLAAEASQDEVQIVREGSADVGALQSGQPARSIGTLVNRILRQAVRAGASAIQVGPTGESGEVRMRLDGLDEHFMHLPTPALVRMVKRLKEMARLEVDHHARRQVGRFRATMGGDAYRFQVRVEPAGGFERVHIRVTRPDDHPDLSQMDLGPGQVAELEQLLNSDGGVVLAVVPEETGRSRMFTAMVQSLGRSGRTVFCLERRIDYDLDQVHMVEVDGEEGLGFADAMQHALEQGPDVVAIGDLSDPRAARLAFDAAARGILVLARCHGDDAIAGVARLTALGIERTRLAGGLRATVAERLLRSICPDCGRGVRVPDDIPSGERALAEVHRVTPTRVPVGCDACRGTGYRGRVPILEVIPFDGRLADLVRAGALLSDLKNAAREDAVPDLRDAGIRRVMAGDTSLREVERVLGPSLTSAGSDRRTVLVVDDTASDRLLMRTLLEEQGFEVLEAPNGVSALAKLKQSSNVALVLLDLLMPELDGHETLACIRSSIRTAGIPVIILTASEDPQLELRLLEAGADDYLCKPFEPGRLMARVRAVLRRATTTTELPAH